MDSENNVNNKIAKFKKVLLAKDKENAKLKKRLEEQQGISWILGQVIKQSSSLDSFPNQMKKITDILMGVLGLSACTVWVKDIGQYITYSRSTSNGNQFLIETSTKLLDVLLEIEKTGTFNINSNKYSFLRSKDTRSVLVAPLYNYKNNKKVGFIVAEHYYKEYFSKNRIDLFDLLAIQISIVGQNSMLFEKVSEFSNKDFLTNCYNRKYLQKIMKNIEEKSKVCTMSIFDMDNFKAVNDIYGHDKGDKLLISVSNLAIKYAKKYDGEVVRYGGDEFIIILYKNLDESKIILQNFIKNAQMLPAIKTLDFSVTFTVGISSYPETAKDIERIFKIADKALIEAKKEGKNKIKIGYDN
ncbi:sensor domain-containing diguanylate cyclase [Clostridiisalibacter paucivorans]|uniref:sensor domain-containing diguanylate cyclase n=1 Tax=Clostridiisalibacter paucivorans TaxID=408753 RepID=UPI000479EB15|nr:sensor domain-containing diguanylate cyclase [Clostridiisalibacter paucivorans]